MRVREWTNFLGARFQNLKLRYRKEGISKMDQFADLKLDSWLVNQLKNIGKLILISYWRVFKTNNKAGPRV